VSDEGRPLLEVVEPGPFTTIQDLGRGGRRAAGVPPGGAMDGFALAAANLLVGNPEGAAGLECALAGPRLRALEACVLAVTGADFQPRLNGRPAPGWTGVFAAAGDELGFAGRRTGARGYIAVAGGLAGERWLGSAGTYLLAERGGHGGRPLRAGDVLRACAPPSLPTVTGRHLPARDRPPYSPEPELAVVPGPHWGRLARAAQRAFLGEVWTVSRDADRMGYRLEGPELSIEGPELVSFGLTAGCVQVPPAGQPIVLMVDGQTAGGYPVIAAVPRCDLPVAAQLLPGDRLRFRRVAVEEAQEEWRRRQRGLDRLRAAVGLAPRPGGAGRRARTTRVAGLEER
jgi:antagonist of KipI